MNIEVLKILQFLPEYISRPSRLVLALYMIHYGAVSFSAIYRKPCSRLGSCRIQGKVLRWVYNVFPDV